MDRIVGFVDLGDEGTDDTTAKPVATHCLQFYVKSLLGNYSRPLMFLATKSLHAQKLVSIVWHVIGKLHECGANVVCLIADGISTNRRAFDIMNNVEGAANVCVNIFEPSLPIFLIVDPPHLLKTARNNVFSSKPNGTRMLQHGKYYILWTHFMKVPYLYESKELRSCKLTEAHLQLKSYTKMRVIYAAQTLSRSVAQLMKARGGDEMARSAWFADIFNSWFECMNTTTNFKDNPDLKPYYYPDDKRLLWLENVFMVELESWKKGITGASKIEVEKKFISQQTYSGLMVTTKSMVELIRFLLKNSPPNTYVLSRRINQDPLEAFFSQIRRAGGSTEVPDLLSYGHCHNLLSVKKQLNDIKNANVTCSDD